MSILMPIGIGFIAGLPLVAYFVWKAERFHTGQHLKPRVIKTQVAKTGDPIITPPAVEFGKFVHEMMEQQRKEAADG